MHKWIVFHRWIFTQCRNEDNSHLASGVERYNCSTKCIEDIGAQEIQATALIPPPQSAFSTETNANDYALSCHCAQKPSISLSPSLLPSISTSRNCTIPLLDLEVWYNEYGEGGRGHFRETYELKDIYWMRNCVTSPMPTSQSLAYP